jgi:1-acyl-sn-glycerol-3-phosphate acyltransferase
MRNASWPASPAERPFPAVACRASGKATGGTIRNKTHRITRAWRWAKLLAHVALALALLRLVFPASSRDRRRRFYGWWSGRLLRALNIVPIIEGEVPPEAARVVFVPNHVSWIDIFFISSIHPTRFIAKSEIREWPVAGWIAESVGTIFIHRARRHDTGRINAVVHSALENGDCVGLFPEGTTTDGDRLLKFHSSLFEPAVANSARVHPVAIRYEETDGTLCRSAAYVGELTFAQSMGLVIRKRRIIARIRFAAPIEAGGLTRRELAAATEASVASLLGLPRPGTKPGTAAGPPAEPR